MRHFSKSHNPIHVSPNPIMKFGVFVAAAAAAGLATTLLLRRKQSRPVPPTSSKPASIYHEGQRVGFSVLLQLPAQELLGPRSMAMHHPIIKLGVFVAAAADAGLATTLLLRWKQSRPVPPPSSKPASVYHEGRRVGFSIFLQLPAQELLGPKSMEYDDAGTVKQNYASILVMLLRLRQACNHPSLIKKKQSDIVEKHSLGMAKQLPREMVFNLLNQLDSLAICGMCNDPPEDPVVTMCGHVFCYQCVSDCVTGEDNQCPQAGCKEMLGTDVVFTRATLRNCVSSDANNDDASSSSALVERPSVTQGSYVSSKIKATLEILNSICNPSSIVDSMLFEGSPPNNAETCTSAHLKSNSEPPVKTIVFSQWTGMLDLLEDSLSLSLVQYRRLDGTMSLNARDMAVKDFNTDPEVTIMLMSLKAGNLGLNMTAASQVILLDPWWNPSAEDQAVDRAHRIGQTRMVTISRLTVSDTVEDRILALQENKKVMISSVFGEDQN